MTIINNEEKARYAIVTLECSLKDIPEEFKTKEVCLAAISIDPTEIQYAPDKMKPSLIKHAVYEFEHKYLNPKQKNYLLLGEIITSFTLLTFFTISIIFITSLVWANIFTAQNLYTHSALNQAAKTTSITFLNRLLVWDNQNLIASINEATEMCDQSTGSPNIKNFILYEQLNRSSLNEKISSSIVVNNVQTLDIGQPTIKVNYTRKLIKGTLSKITNENAYIILTPIENAPENYKIKNFVIEK